MGDGPAKSWWLRSRLTGLALGAALIAAGIGGVLLIDLRPKPAAEPDPVRPLKTLEIGAPGVVSTRRYPGKVTAYHTVDQAFEVSGRLMEKHVNEGDQVTKGELMARLDPRDYQNALNASKAIEAREKANRDRVAEAFSQDVATSQELTNAEAKYNVAIAEVAIKAKAVEDTYLPAMFTGLVARTYVENFANVKAKEPVVNLQDISRIQVEINVPEERIALARKGAHDLTFKATFEYLPGRAFDMTIKEFSTEADPVTQTFVLTLVMPGPEGVTILPGMTATVYEYRRMSDGVEEGYAVPIDAVAIDGQGGYYVWKLTGTGAEGEYTTHRVDVEVGEMVEGSIVVTEGVATGDHIAAAGVHLLTEGRRVRLHESVWAGEESQ